MNANELKNAVNRGKIENIYLLAGPEIGEKNEIIKILKQKIFQDSKPTVYTYYCANDFEPAEFSDILNSGLLFSEKKLVILKNIEEADKSTIGIIADLLVPRRIREDAFENNILSKLRDDEKKKSFKSFYKNEKGSYFLKESTKNSDLKKIIALLESANYKNYDENTFLVMLNESNDKIPAELLSLLNQNQYVIFWEMFENQKPVWVRQIFKSYDLFIEDDAVQFILDTVENNKFQLENEINRIAVSFDTLKKTDKKVVTREIIEEYLFHSKAETAFSLYSAMLEKNLDKSFDILNKIFSTEQELILPGLVWSHRRFLKALDLYENQKLPVEEVFTQLNIGIKKVKEEIAGAFVNFNFSEASMMFNYLSELDYYLKVLPEELKLVKLQEFIINFICGDIKKSFLRGKIITGHFDNISM